MSKNRTPVPRDKQDDYTRAAADARQDFVAQQTETELNHIGQYSFEPATLAGNIENFTGVAQVPVGLAGPLTINGEYAQGEFYIPMATTEGTLVASYNRGMRLLSECGGVKTTITEQFVQRSPVFMFDDARQARDFGKWVEQHLPQIKDAAESTTSVGKLSHIEQYAVGCLRYLRFNYTTGDAAGQNMVGKATFAACEWIKQNHPDKACYMLSGNIDTDKKHSHINVLHTRGKRVIAEAIIRNDALQHLMGVDTARLYKARQISNTGAFLANSSNNGAHAANGITALFIATGQDAANVAESHAAISFSKLLDSGDYYWSITLPALIVATYGGGTGLATQRECLEMLGCYGTGGANKLAEICAATVLAGETSLGSAVLAGDWVTSHDELGRNRP
ncbi:MAG: hydroxymethylglutaryl-CoA reductase [Pseudomonadales bacterium]